MIKEQQLTNPKGHANILTDMLRDQRDLFAISDKAPSKYIFQRRFHTRTPTLEDWQSGNLTESLEGDVWFTDASVKPRGCGYGIVDTSTNTTYTGYLGRNLR